MEDRVRMEDREEGTSHSVVVLSCGPLGRRTANRLVALDGVGAVTLVTTPYRTRKRSLPGKVAWAWRMEGPRGLGAAAVRRCARVLGWRRTDEPSLRSDGPELDPRVGHLSFDDFHRPECLAALQSAEPDLGVLAGTYILEEEVFGIPRLGTINLHSGKVPEYRGAAPAFWELYHGETEVGITIHEVVRDVDAGRILRQELFPLDPAPSGDPLAYLDRYRTEVLEPNGIRLLVETVREIAAGRAAPRPQDVSRARTFRSPDHRAKRELRRRVARRRRAARRARGVPSHV